MKKLLGLLILAPLAGLAQDDVKLPQSAENRGVHFEQELTWQQVKEKAKKENKYIFVDCYATWCGPCKEMDKVIYPNDTVGEFLNDRFVSVKVQMDTSEKDDTFTQSWYPDAHQIMVDCKVAAYPTFLFLSPDGTMVHRGVGYQPKVDFLVLAKDAMDSTKQYHALIAAYKEGKRDYTIMPSLARSAKAFEDRKLASSIATEYLHGYLDELSFSDICTRMNLQFVSDFANVLSSKDKVFELFYKHPEMPDSLAHDKDFSDRFVNFIITKEEITPFINKARKENTDPDWVGMSETIKNKYGTVFVEKNIVDAKVDWYRSVRDWTNYTKYLVRHMDLVGIQNIPNSIMGVLILNNSAWEIFKYSNNREELGKAISWSDRAIQMQPTPTNSTLDTKANLLYKLGKKSEGLSLETKALKLDPKAKDISENLQKMQRGEATW